MFFIETIKDIYSEYKEYILFLLLLILLILTSIGITYYLSNDISKLKKELKEKPVVEVKNETKETKKYVVDIKGAVKTPGVYVLDKNSRVIDVVNKAGGFTSKADSFANNLSMKIKDEMVIIIYSKDEIDDYIKTKEKESKVEEKCKNDIIQNDSCAKYSYDSKEETKTTSKTKNSKSSEEKQSEENKLVSINTATKEELMTVSGIGESKAEAIIEYRKTKKFENIEEIKEVSGIGDALFEKIKDYITT